MDANSDIVFFDGFCHLCNRTVRMLLRMNTRGNLRFAPLSGTTAAGLLPKALVDHSTSVVYLRRGKILTHSDAVIWALADTGLYLRWFAVLRFVPRLIRDKIYDFIAARRFRWFGKSEYCSVPLNSDKNRFLN